MNNIRPNSRRIAVNSNLIHDVVNSNSRRTTVNYNSTVLGLTSFFILPKKLFSTTCIRKGDPLGITVISYGYPYAQSLLFNPIGSAFIVLTGMAITLFFVTQSLGVSFMADPSYALLDQRLDAIFLLYERFFTQESLAINSLSANIDNYSTRELYNFYCVLL
jgi:hypothetical protein